MHFYTANKIYVSKYIRVPFGTAVQQILKDPDFIKPHVSYIIHMKYVKKMRSMSFIMTKGYEVPISKKSSGRLQEILHAIFARRG